MPDEPRHAETEQSSTPAASLSDFDIHLFHEGTHARLHRHLGAHRVERDGRSSVEFGVWAPNASSVSVVGDFNGWAKGEHLLDRIEGTGVWAGTVEGLEKGAIYKYHIESRQDGYAVDKADPFGFHHETPPATGSRVWDLAYDWNDDKWMSERGERQPLTAPMSIYEVHLGSWRRHDDGTGPQLSYDDLAETLPAYAAERGFTHVELMPITEHPYAKSWGYQTTGYFAPTSRFGTPQGFMRLVDALHQHGIGVVLDWVPSHFPTDEHGLGFFDGTHLFEHADPRKGFHPDWKSLIFNYDRSEVRAFLISSALFWIETYHIDAIRVDAVSSMLYLDYSREKGEWIPNEHGGRENLGAVVFLEQLNTEIKRSFPDVRTIAEEATSWPGVTAPVDDGGLGFDSKWDMGWMHDTLKHLSRDGYARPAHFNELTFRGMYMFSENGTLALSHDEVVHGKGSLINKMDGDDWQKFANLRLLLANQWAHPGKKLLFMGGEFAQRREWSEERQLDWELLKDAPHMGIRNLVDRLNELHTSVPALHEYDCDPRGFEWIEADDAEWGILAFLRRGNDADDPVVCVFNTRTEVREGYRLGVPDAGAWAELLNTDDESFGGTGVINAGTLASDAVAAHNRERSVVLTIPPLGAVYLGRSR